MVRSAWRLARDSSVVPSRDYYTKQEGDSQRVIAASAKSHKVSFRLGGCKPGELNHSLRCATVSSVRAFFSKVSRSLPGGKFLARSRDSRASSSRRSVSDVVCLNRRRISVMGEPPTTTSPKTNTEKLNWFQTARFQPVAVVARDLNGLEAAIQIC